MLGHAPVVSLLLETPGVDPLAVHVRDLWDLSHAIKFPGPTQLFFGCMQAGKTPLDRARANRHTAVVMLLEADPRMASALVAENVLATRA